MKLKLAITTCLLTVMPLASFAASKTLQCPSAANLNNPGPGWVKTAHVKNPSAYQFNEALLPSGMTQGSAHCYYLSSNQPKVTLVRAGDAGHTPVTSSEWQRVANPMPGNACSISPAACNWTTS